jgi:protein SCO1/2
MPRKFLIAIAVALPMAVLLLLFSARRAAHSAAELPVYWSVPAFTLLDQDSSAFSSSELKGHVWLASFVYTNCPDFCPLITKHMAELRNELKEDGRLGAVRLLSITVDPARDTPGVLRAYARKFGAAQPDWVFLTGAPETVLPLINNGFHLTALHGAARDSMQHTHTLDTLPAKYTITHTDRIVLIDQAGQVRATYQTTEPGGLETLRKDLKRLLD